MVGARPVAVAAVMLAACSSTTERAPSASSAASSSWSPQPRWTEAAAVRLSAADPRPKPRRATSITDPKQTERARANRQAPHSRRRRSSARTRWTGSGRSTCLTSPEINAWCMPGGKIAVYTGIHREAPGHGRRDRRGDGARDLARAARDTVASEPRSRWRAGVGASLAGGPGRHLPPRLRTARTGGAGLGAQVEVLLPYSRVQETEADRMGVELPRRGPGTTRRAAIVLWQKMAQISGGSASPQLLSTHPSN